MFGTDEFGNSKLLPAAFLMVFAVLSLATLISSQSMWEAPPAAPHEPAQSSGL